MLEDFLDDPKGELRWFGWAFLLLVGLTFAATLAYVGIALPQERDILKSASPIVIAGAAVRDGMNGAAQLWSQPIFGLMAVIGLFIARNFLAAFRHHRPHVMAIIGIIPLFYIGLAEVGAPDYVVFWVTLAAIVWTLLLPAPHTGERMTQATRGLAVGLVCALLFELGGVLVAAVYAGWMLYRQRFIEAAIAGISASLPPLLIASGSLALDRSDTTAVLYGLMLSVVLIEGFIGLLLDSFGPEPATDEVDAVRPEESSDEQPVDEDRAGDEAGETPGEPKRPHRWG